MPENAIYVGRPTKWGNPFKIQEGYTGQRCLDLYRKHISVHLAVNELDLSELTGKDLACFCPLNQPCHADVLLELANAPDSIAAM